MLLGPLAPVIMEIWPEAMLAIIIGIKNGLTRLGPFSIRMVCCSSQVCRPPMPEPTYTPTRSGSAFSPIFKPASFNAAWLVTTAN
ncbi:hypothetical protein D3C81_2172440 [compost metagenome]